MAVKTKTVNRIAAELNGDGPDDLAPVRITIEAPKEERIRFKLNGLTPFRAGAWSDEALRGLKDHPEYKAVKSTGKRVDAQLVASGKCYQHPEGGYAIPVMAIKKALQAAAADRIVPGNKRSVATIVKRFVRVVPDSSDGQFLRLTSPGYEIEILPGRNSGIGRTPRVILRPLFKAWSIEVAIDYDTRWFDGESIANLLAEAGRTVGIGEWRPEKGGDSGRFEVQHA